MKYQELVCQIQEMTRDEIASLYPLKQLNDVFLDAWRYSLASSSTQVTARQALKDLEEANKAFSEKLRAQLATFGAISGRQLARPISITFEEGTVRVSGYDSLTGYTYEIWDGTRWVPESVYRANKQEQELKPCWHKWERYQGFTETYDFCTKCDCKQEVKL